MRRRRHALRRKRKTQTSPCCLLLSHVHPNRTKLRHLRTRVACRDEGPRPLEALPRLDQTSLYCPHRPPKPPILEGTTKPQPMNARSNRCPPAPPFRYPAITGTPNT